jgi:hypothetical protein
MTSYDEQRRKHDFLGLLLGPVGPELSCEECFEALDRYVDLEIIGADADVGVPGMRAHLQGCPACGEDHRSLLALVQAELSPSAGGPSD